jgi:alcohol dehydrogenase
MPGSDGARCRAKVASSTEPGGVCTSIGGYYSEMLTPIPMFEMYVTGITFITGRAHVRVPIPELLYLAAQGTIQPDLVTTKTVAWQDAREAVAEAEVKLVIEREPETS